MSAEARVGVFFLLTLILVGAVALYLGDIWIRTSSYTITAHFKDAQGLPAGSEVRLAGVRIGKVTAVKIEPNDKFPGTLASVRMAIERNVDLYDTDHFLIQQSAVLGDKCVQVQRQTQQSSKVLSPDKHVAGGSGASLADMADEARALIKEARGAVASVRNIVASEQSQLAFQQILFNVVSATHKADLLASQAMQLAATLNQTAKTAGPDVAVMAGNLRQASASVASTAQLVRQILATSPIPRDMALASANVRRATGDIATISGNMAAVLGDPKTRDQVAAAVSNLTAASLNLARLTAGADQMLADGQVEKDVRQTMRKLSESAAHLANITASTETLLTDPHFQADIRGTVAGARQLTETGVGVAQRADHTLERVERTVDKVQEVTQSIRPDATYPRATLLGQRHGGLRADYEVDFQYGSQRNSFWRLGLIDIGDSERVNFQRAVPVGPDGRVRVGVFGNKAGLGYDALLSHRLNFEADIYDPNNITFDARAIFSANQNTDVFLGIMDISGNREPVLGTRYRWNP